MILRRVIEHVKGENWFAVALDFIIVVAGVFIGIQVANWNAARIEEGRAHGYLERIRADLDADLAHYDDSTRFWRRVSDFGAQGLGYADSGDTTGTSQWELLVAFFQASQVNEIIMNTATYEELKSAGELALIVDTENHRGARDRRGAAAHQRRRREQECNVADKHDRGGRGAGSGRR